MISICSYKSALFDSFALPLTTRAPGREAVAALRMKIKDIFTRIRPWRAFVSSLPQTLHAFSFPRCLNCTWASSMSGSTILASVQCIGGGEGEQSYVSYIKLRPVIHAVASHIYVFAEQPPPVNFDCALLLDPTFLEPPFEIRFEKCCFASAKSFHRVTLDLSAKTLSPSLAGTSRKHKGVGKYGLTQSNVGTPD